MAFCLKIKFVCQRSECALTLDQPASLLPVLSIITLNHLKHGCRDVKKRGDVYGLLRHILYEGSDQRMQRTRDCFVNGRGLRDRLVLYQSKLRV